MNGECIFTHFVDIETSTARVSREDDERDHGEAEGKQIASASICPKRVRRSLKQTHTHTRKRTNMHRALKLRNFLFCRHLQMLSRATLLCVSTPLCQQCNANVANLHGIYVRSNPLSRSSQLHSSRFIFMRRNAQIATTCQRTTATTNATTARARALRESVQYERKERDIENEQQNN